MNDPQVLNEAPKQDTQGPKKPYDKPKIIYRAPLEAIAGQCIPQPPGKASGLPPVLCTNLTS